MWTRRARDGVLAGLIGLSVSGAAAAQGIRSSLTVAPHTAQPVSDAGLGEDLLLQLEVFMNGRPLYLVSAFTLRADGRMVSSRTELEEIGLVIPESLAAEVEIALDRLAGVTFVYDEAAQAIRFTAAQEALSPAVIRGRPAEVRIDPVRPPPGLVLNYTLYASATEAADGFAFDGISAALESRLFGRWGLIENSAIVRAGPSATGIVRLDSAYIHEEPARLRTIQAGDLISGGFSWTRSIRMGGIQLRRSFGLRPDLVTLPVPDFEGSAAAPSTLDLFINNVRTLSAEVPQGPFRIEQPPIVHGAGVARIVVRDALGRETVASSAFYASPELLAPGLTDFSLEAGFARRNYASRSFDYDGRPALSLSWRRGLDDGLTLQAHAESVGSLFLLGGGAIFTIGRFGLGSVAVAGSRTAAGTGALVDLAFESRLPWLTVTARMQRSFGDYEDIASWTAVLPPELASERRIFGQPKELDQLLLSLPLPWEGGAFGASYIHSRRETERSRIVTLSYNQDIGRFSLFASAFRDFEQSGSTGIFLGLSVPLGRGITATGGATHRRGDLSGYVEVSRQDHHHPGQVGWTLRGAAGERQELEGTARYSSRFARFEAGLLHVDGVFAGHLLMEGAVTLIGGGIHASHRVDQSFALVEAGAPGIAILYENRPAGTTDRHGQLLVPNLAPFAVNRIALDPANLPIDAEVAATAATVAPYSRVAALVDFAVETDTASALVTFVDVDGRPIELGADVLIEGHEEHFVVGYEGQAFVRGLVHESVAIVTTPDLARCRAPFRYRRTPGEQVRIEDVVCRPME